MATIPTCEPRVVDGAIGWMAVTPSEHPYRIGVVGVSEADARARFVVALAAWQELHDRAEDGA